MTVSLAPSSSSPGHRSQATSSDLPQGLPVADACLLRMQQVLRQEAQAIAGLASQLTVQHDQLVSAILAIRDCPGRVIVTGVGKAGLIGRKVAATLASTGTPAAFMHPTEAHHGDLGMVTDHDVVLALSHSGSSNELVDLLPHIKRIGAQLIAMVGRLASPLAQHADLVLHIGELPEACPLGLAPSTSTSVMLALGDALSFAVLDQRGFSREDYARFHPAGALGRKLMTVAEAMRRHDRLAVAHPDEAIQAVLAKITSARAGSALLVDEQHQLLGLFSDGDLRRALADGDAVRILAAPVRAYATMPCRSIGTKALLAEALRLCAKYNIDELPVVDDEGKLLGLIDLQDLADRGFDTGI